MHAKMVPVLKEYKVQAKSLGGLKGLLDLKLKGSRGL